MTRASYLLAAAAIATCVAPAAAQRGPAPAATHLPSDVLTLACLPRLTDHTPDMPLRLTGGQDSFVRRNFQPGDLVTINAGRTNGIEVGQEYYVRRVEVKYHQPVTPQTPGLVQTAGWIRVWAVDDDMSLATIVHACDSIEVGDYLEPFALPKLPQVSPDKPKPERGNYAHVLRGEDNRESFGTGDFFTIDRGTSGGVYPGAQFVLYRDKHEANNFLYELGEAVAVDVGPETATLLVTEARDALARGDYVAMRK
jgi:hypothetical protein